MKLITGSQNFHSQKIYKFLYASSLSVWHLPQCNNQNMLFLLIHPCKTCIELASQYNTVMQEYNFLLLECGVKQEQ